MSIKTSAGGIYAFCLKILDFHYCFLRVQNFKKLAIISVSLLSLTLSSCFFQPPWNNFRDNNQTPKRAVVGVGLGAAAGAIAGYPIIGAVVGGVIGTSVGLYKDSKPGIIRELQKHDVEFIQYGDTMTLIVPTDHYFLFNSPRLNELCYPGLLNIIRLLKYYPNSPIYVAGFTDDVGSRYHKKTLSQAQAEAMLTFLWANNIPAQQLQAEGYGDKHPVGDNHLIHGSAYNRHLQIQWISGPIAIPQRVAGPVCVTK